MTALDRFMDRISPEPMSGCWLWTSCVLKKDGYGQFSIGNKNTTAHRASWMLFRGDIPVGMVVCHKCDVPECVNPDHLFIGTLGDNMDDMHRKGRHPNSPSRKTCRKGHVIAEVGLYTGRQGTTYCMACKDIADKKYRPVRRLKYAIRVGKVAQ